MATTRQVPPASVPDLPIHELLALEAVSRLGSVQAAADALHVTPSGISHRIASLERKIGATLLLRKGRGVALSAVAMDYVGVVRQGLADLSTSTENLRQGEHRIIRIATAAAVGASWLLPLLRQFKEGDLEAQFEIATGGDGRRIAAGSLGHPDPLRRATRDTAVGAGRCSPID